MSMKSFQPAIITSRSHVTDDQLESAINEATVYGACFPMLSDGRTVDIKKLAQWMNKTLRRSGYGISRVVGEAPEP